MERSCNVKIGTERGLKKGLVRKKVDLKEMEGSCTIKKSNKRKLDEKIN
jgi:hypothetical protein